MYKFKNALKVLYIILYYILLFIINITFILHKINNYI